MNIILGHHQPSNLMQLVVKQWFLSCANKSRCIGGTLPKRLCKMPTICIVWPVKDGVNFTQVEVDALVMGGFHLVPNIRFH
jgi:hypothetical protein